MCLIFVLLFWCFSALAGAAFDTALKRFDESIVVRLRDEDELEIGALLLQVATNVA